MPDDLSGTGETGRLVRSNWLYVGLLASSAVIAAAVLGSILIWSGGDDAEVASASPADKRSVKVIVAGTNDAKEEVIDGGIVGEGTFKASGAISDRGTATAYRGLSVVDERVILLRFVTKGREGTITYAVKIDTSRRPVVTRWTIESATRAYKGLQGRGSATDNRTFTVTTLRGKVWR